MVPRASPGPHLQPEGTLLHPYTKGMGCCEVPRNPKSLERSTAAPLHSHPLTQTAQQTQSLAPPRRSPGRHLHGCPPPPAQTELAFLTDSG